MYIVTYRSVSVSVLPVYLPMTNLISAWKIANPRRASRRLDACCRLIGPILILRLTISILAHIPLSLIRNLFNKKNWGAEPHRPSKFGSTLALSSKFTWAYFLFYFILLFLEILISVKIDTQKLPGARKIRRALQGTSGRIFCLTLFLSLSLSVFLVRSYIPSSSTDKKDRFLRDASSRVAADNGG